MKKVFICSQYGADDSRAVSANIERALSACAYALNKGYAPIAPHLIYPRCLDDAKPKEREMGINAGLAWLSVCDELWQCNADVSKGMSAEIAHARKLGIPVKVFHRNEKNTGREENENGI